MEEDNKLLSEKNLKLTRRVGRYKKRKQKLKMSQRGYRSPSPNNRVQQTIKNGPEEIKRELHLHFRNR